MLEEHVNVVEALIGDVQYFKPSAVLSADCSDIANVGSQGTEVGGKLTGCSVVLLFVASQGMNLCQSGFIFSPNEGFTLIPAAREHEDYIPNQFAARLPHRRRVQMTRYIILIRNVLRRHGAIS